jgi:MoxR-like ATPase
MEKWHIFLGTGIPSNRIAELPPPPPWRRFNGDVAETIGKKEEEIERILSSGEFDELERSPQLERRFAGIRRGATYQAEEEEIHLVNAALYLRRPLLVTGKPGSGKSSLAFAIAHELALGRVLEWRITSRSTLKNALYHYEAIGRFQDFEMTKQEPDIGEYIRLGPLGTALLPGNRPRVLLIDEIDKSDIDLPNDLLHVFEEGAFEIDELLRMAKKKDSVEVLTDDGDDKVAIVGGRVKCRAFPIIVLTSNGERELPPPFLRRCVRLDLPKPSDQKLERIVQEYFQEDPTLNSSEREQRAASRKALLDDFVERAQHGDLATDQLLNAIYLRLNHVKLEISIDALNDTTKLIDAVLRYLNESAGQ